LSTPAWAQPEEDAFNDGLKAREDKKWEEAATHMRRAIQLNPQESPKRVGGKLGGVFGLRAEYLPHYFLGEALFSLNDCVGAMEQWAISEQQGAIKSRRDFLGFVQRGYTTCDGKGVLSPAKFDPLNSRTQQQVADVTTLSQSVSALAQQYSDLPRSREMREQADRAGSEVQSAVSHLAAARKTRQEKEFTEASAAVDRARSILTTLNANLNSAISTLNTLQVQAKDVEKILDGAGDLDRLIDTKKTPLTAQLATLRQSAAEALTRSRSLYSAKPLTSSNVAEARTLALDATGKLRSVNEELDKIIVNRIATQLADATATGNQQMMSVELSFATLNGRIQKSESVPIEVPTQREALQKRYEQIRRRYDAAVATRSLTGIQENIRLAANVQMEVETITRAFGPITLREQVGSELADASRQFLSGEYQQVVATLDPTKVGGVAMQLHVHLFRAASFYALYVRSGEKDEAQRTQALAEIDQCKQLNSTFQPDPRVFAPRFITFFQNATTAAKPAAPSGSSPQ
jgi:hypothetical protein